MRERISWEELFLGIAYYTAMRSIDESSQIGCVITDNCNRFLTSGYNSGPAGINDLKIPQTRPEKYEWFVHAEEAAICNAAKKGICIDNSIMYVTALPCPRCMRKIINSGIKTVYYINGEYKSKNEELMKITFKMSKESKVQLIELDKEIIKKIKNNFNILSTMLE